MIRSLTLFYTLAAFAIATSLTAAQDAAPAPLKAKLQTIADTHKAENAGLMGIYYKNLTNGETVAINADELFPTASTIKLPVACTLLATMTDPDTSITSYYETVPYDLSTSSSGAGFIQNYKPNTPLEIKELLHLMITVSDNTGTNMLVKRLGGPQVVNEWLDANGFTKTRMFSTVGGGQVADQEGRRVWGLGATTPAEMGDLMEKLSVGKLLETTATEELLRVLGHQYFDDLIAAQVPPQTYVGSKSGAVNASRSDCAIVCGPTTRYVLIVYTKDNKDTSWGNSNFAENAIQQVSREVWKHTQPKSTYQSPKGRL